MNRDVSHLDEVILHLINKSAVIISRLWFRLPMKSLIHKDPLALLTLLIDSFEERKLVKISSALCMLKKVRNIIVHKGRWLSILNIMSYNIDTLSSNFHFTDIKVLLSLLLTMKRCRLSKRQSIIKIESPNIPVLMSDNIMSFRDIKTKYPNLIKGKVLKIMDGKYRGSKAVFIHYSGSVVNIVIEGVGKKYLSNDRLISIID